MTKDVIYKHLNDYRINKARLEMLKAGAEKLDQMLNELESIRGCKGISLSLAPSGRTNKISSSVADEVERREAHKEEMREIKEQLYAMDKEISELQQNIKMVDVWVAALTADILIWPIF